jgi:hypothetical protein
MVWLSSATRLPQAYAHIDAISAVATATTVAVAVWSHSPFQASSLLSVHTETRVGGKELVGGRRAWHQFGTDARLIMTLAVAVFPPREKILITLSSTILFQMSITEMTNAASHSHAQCAEGTSVSRHTLYHWVLAGNSSASSGLGWVC